MTLMSTIALRHYINKYHMDMDDLCAKMTPLNTNYMISNIWIGNKIIHKFEEYKTGFSRSTSSFSTHINDIYNLTINCKIKLDDYQMKVLDLDDEKLKYITKWESQFRETMKKRDIEKREERKIVRKKLTKRVKQVLYVVLPITFTTFGLYRLYHR